MKAVVCHAPLDLRVEERDVPELGPRDVMVRIRAGGICGSDLHYYQHGGFGTVRIREPLVLGHEIAGEVMQVGSEVTAVRPGDGVAVNPSRPCGHCRFCAKGMQSHCLNMRFFGSAMLFPHVQGGFREVLVCTEQQAVKVPDGFDITLAAFGEPLAVCLHAARQAGPLLGQRVLVTGTGPIGALTILVARQAGASEIVATDLLDEPLDLMRKLGADSTVNVRTDPNGLDKFAAEKGYFDVVFEASGNERALISAFTVARPCATIVQLGIGAGNFTLPLNTVVAKEINLRGTFRFHEEFAWAVQFIASGAIDVAPLLTERVPLSDVQRGFELAADRARAMKVQLAF